MIIIGAANELSKSKIFQYSCGMLSFAFGGFLLTLLFVLYKLLGDKSKNSMLRNVSVVALFTTYGASLVYALRSNIGDFLLEHWEASAAYLAVTSGAGLLVTRILRGDEGRKHAFKTFGE